MTHADRPISGPEATLLSRRSLLSVGALLAPPSACAAPVVRIAQIDLDAIGPNQVLLLGRVRVTALDMDRTGDTFIRSTAGSDEKLLPLMERSPGSFAAGRARRSG